MVKLPVYTTKLVRERTLNSEVPKIRGPADVYTLLKEYLEDADREHFVVLHVDTQHQVRGVNTVSIGSLDASIVHPREVFKAAIIRSAAAVILAHNHPSGDPTPSSEDREVTKQLLEGGKLLGIPVLDHVVIGEGRYVSFVEARLLGLK